NQNARLQRASVDCTLRADSYLGIIPTSFSTSAVSTITIASQGQPSRNEPSGPLLVHFLQPIHRIGSTWMRPNGGLSSSGTQNMQSSTGQYSTHAGEPAHPVQHSVMTANSFGFFLRGVVRPLDLGSNFSSSGTIPAGLLTTGSAAIVGIIPESQNDVICLFSKHLTAKCPEDSQRSQSNVSWRSPRDLCAPCAYMPS